MRTHHRLSARLFYTLRCLTLAVLFVPAVSHATISPALMTELDNMCGKMKVCVSEMFGEQAQNEQMKAMVNGIADQACEQTKIEMRDIPDDPAIQKAAIACMRSVNTLSCNQLTEDFETPECKQLEKFDLVP
ncbi:hypothetical protein [Enterovibrio norvegicus]|uniref:Cysteine rich repeat-containing protein n=2 Tax=Enterovibrio norvegicus TaxID=188144 RepID=A0A1I5KGA4_9GAMM|nr:hypothetical protein [Enterovibrio norvegicus]OEF55975.1 hypothetical protein A1OU_14440 [Enterovibrio norvegicus]PMI32479.1 hypothetical protein BCU47_02360 [Enterovibrio norvegicus]TKF11426.1 hypothetical protein FCV66_17255 [Enterovibrio norvegicus]SFO83651.1 hypothetical protein SAMN03084138_00621 [Enterovibrio norvegicus DSM 15893]